MDVQTNILQNRLNELSARVHKLSEEFRNSGEFSHIHRALHIQIQRRRNALRDRVRRAEENGLTWELVRAEFARDFSSLADTFLQLEEWLDSEAMKKR